MDTESTLRRAPREVARDAVRTHVTVVALELFEELGYESVAIEQIAERAGISRRTFHRYFAAKEDVIVGDAERSGATVRSYLEARPHAEPVWVSLRRSYEHVLAPAAREDALGKRLVALMVGTAALRARNLEKHMQWVPGLVPIVLGRLEGHDRELRAEALVHASLACLDLSLLTWVRSPDGVALDTVLNQVFGALDVR